MFCSRCGEKLSPDVRFCHKCGNEINQISHEQAHQQQQFQQQFHPQFQPQFQPQNPYQNLKTNDLQLEILRQNESVDYGEYLRWEFAMSKAKTARTFGIVSLIALGVIFGSIALAMGIKARAALNELYYDPSFHPPLYSHMSKATAGIVTGIIGIIINILGIIIAVYQ